MIRWFNSRSNVIKYFICIVLILSLLSLLKILLNDYNFEYIKNNNDKLEKRLISAESNNYKMLVYYPKFHNTKIDNIIADYVYDYIKGFKEEAKKQEYTAILIINYNISFIGDYLNIYFNVFNNLNYNDKNKSILINTKEYKIARITDLYGEAVIKNKIDKTIKSKYSTSIYNKINNMDINTFDYNINGDVVTVYLDNIIFTDVSYIPTATFSITEDDYYEDYVVDSSKKMVALTFDDGPGEYTLDFIELLKLNNSKATFFMIGKRMNNNKNIVKMVYESGNEIGGHTYSHKNLTKISSEQVLEEINSVAVLYNQITKENIKYLRVPYGSFNNKVKSLSEYPLIEWSIDPYDWLYRDAEKEADHIISNVYDGAIILLHEVYPESLEAAKILIPELKEMGYELVTVSNLAKYKNYTIPVGKIIREIK